MTASTANLGSDSAGDDLSRNVFCLLGMPIDVEDMPSVLAKIRAAAACKVPFFITAPNLNTLVTMQSDPDFRRSLYESDLCPVDGMPIVWMARLLGIPIKSRIAGSDMFDALKSERGSAEPLKVFLFGGLEGVAVSACRALNDRPSGISCVGSFYPGFGSVDDMSGDDVIARINSSGADFLVVSLGAQKGQLWLLRNHRRLLTPVRAHLGAVVNFQAAAIRRAPVVLRQLGLEWMWRIREEPHLWRRYWNDGRSLMRMLFSRVLPLLISRLWLRLGDGHRGQDLTIEQARNGKSVTLILSGTATSRHVDKAIPAFRDAIGAKRQVVIDLSQVRVIDARFFGLLLMLRKKLADGPHLRFIGLSRGLERLFRLNGLGFLLSSGTCA